MGQLVLLVVAAAWAAVLLPPLLRSRIENRPNSSVTDFRNQLSSLQKAMPSRAVSMRSMSRPLASSPLSRPAATGRPGMRTGVRTHGGGRAAPARTTANGHHAPRHDVRHDVRLADASLRPRSHGERRAALPQGRSRPVAAARHTSGRDSLKRRRANVLFVLALVSGCSLFLAATTKTDALFYVFGAAFAALCGYVYVLGQLRRREAEIPAAPVPAPRPVAQSRPAVARARQLAPAPIPRERWSHAV